MCIWGGKEESVFALGATQRKENLALPSNFFFFVCILLSLSRPNEMICKGDQGSHKTCMCSRAKSMISDL